MMKIPELALILALGCSSADRLTVDLSDRKYTVNKSEEEGVKDIRRLLKEYYEEAWAYLPEKNLWIEIGENARKSSLCDGTRLEIDVSFLHKLNDNKVIVYHFHPDIDEFRLEKILRKADLSDELLTKNGKFMFRAAIPSFDDIENMALNSAVFYRSRPNGSISYKTCSKFGVTEFFLTEKGRRVFKGKSIMEDKIILRLLEERMNTSLYEWRTNTKTGTEDFDVALSNEYVRVKFTPYN